MRFKNKFYKAVLKYGHAGVGRYLELTRLIIARDIKEAMEIAMKLPGVKKKKGLNAIEKLERVDEPLNAFKIVVEDEMQRVRKHLKQKAISPAAIHKVFEIAYQFSW